MGILICMVDGRVMTRCTLLLLFALFHHFWPLDAAEVARNFDISQATAPGAGGIPGQKPSNYRKALDFEQQQLDVFVAIPDGGNGIPVTINVLDVNDNAPIFPVPVFDVQLSETARLGTVILLPSAIDADSGHYAVQRYRLASGNVNDAFRLSTNGVRHLDLIVNAGLDRELRDSHKLQIDALDGGYPPRYARLLVHVTVIDANDNAPQFSQSRYSVEILQNITVGSRVIQYGLLQSHTPFAINPTTGVITVSEPLSLYSTNSYELAVAARDQGLQPLETVVFVTVSVIVLPQNQGCGEFSVTDATISYDTTPVSGVVPAGTSATVTCTTNYVINGVQSASVTCIGPHWDTTLPSKCSGPCSQFNVTKAAVTYSAQVSGVILSGETAKITCEANTLLETLNTASASLTCAGPNWSPTAPSQCLSACSEFTVTDANVVYSSSDSGLVPDGQTATVTCSNSTGYFVQGTGRTSTVSQCNSTVWSPKEPSSCVLGCVDFTVTNAVVSHVGGNGYTADGTSATVTCNNNYLIETANTKNTSVACSGQSWSPTPPTQCVAACSEFSVTNAAVTYTSSDQGSVPNAGVATVTCSGDNYVVENWNLTTVAFVCNAPNWNDTVPTKCTGFACQPLTITGGTVTYSAQSGTIIPVGATATVNCTTPGNALANEDGVSKVVTCVAPDWSANASCATVCQQNLGTPSNAATPTYTTTRGDGLVNEGDTAQSSCNTNYYTFSANSASTSSSATCTSGAWNPTALNACTYGCTTPLSTDAHGTISYSGEVSTDAGTTVAPANAVASLICNQYWRYMQSNMTNNVTCVDGTGWSGTMSTCETECQQANLGVGAVLDTDAVTCWVSDSASTDTFTSYTTSARCNTFPTANPRWANFLSATVRTAINTQNWTPTCPWVALEANTTGSWQWYADNGVTKVDATVSNGLVWGDGEPGSFTCGCLDKATAALKAADCTTASRHVCKYDLQ